MIRLLSENLANQIAAGEVIERPASVIKELVENALDAGATMIQVESDQGGRFLRVVDNGQGIPADSLSLAFQRFATSKIQSYEDLWALNTMGFRGEALPSIASVSKVNTISRQAEDTHAQFIRIHGGKTLEEGQTGAPLGTSMTIQDLFYNTPARLKFMKTDNTEYGYIQKLMQSFALAYPEVSFKWIKKGKESLYTTGQGELMTVVRQLFGKQMAESLYTISHEHRAGKVTGALSYPDFVRKDRNYQFFFINRRHVKVPGITRILDDIYQDLVPKRHYPVAILNLELPPDSLDVNVHPSKQEVKFKNFSQIYQMLKEAIQQALAQFHVHRDASSETEAKPVTPQSKSEESPPWLQASSPIDLEPPPWQSEATITQGLNTREPVDTYTADTSYLDVELPKREPELLKIPDIEPPEPPKDTDTLADLITPLGQISGNTFIVGTYGEGLCLVDQHVAEERYLYEKIIADAQIASQPILMAVVIEVDAIEQSLLNEHQSVFHQAGFEFEPYGPTSIAIRALPFCLKLSEAENTFRTLLEDLKATGTTSEHIAPYKLLCKTIACHAAIRAGDPLTLEQMREMIKNWAQTKNPYTCPHGRPILLKFTKDELKKRFLRTW